MGTLFLVSPTGEPPQAIPSQLAPVFCRSIEKSRRPKKRGFRRQSGRLDSNQRPLGPQPSALPDCATPRSGLRDRTRPVRHYGGRGHGRRGNHPRGLPRAHAQSGRSRRHLRPEARDDRRLAHAQGRGAARPAQGPARLRGRGLHHGHPPAAPVGEPAQRHALRGGGEVGHGRPRLAADQARPERAADPRPPRRPARTGKSAAATDCRRGSTSAPTPTCSRRSPSLTRSPLRSRSTSTASRSPRPSRRARASRSRSPSASTPTSRCPGDAREEWEIELPVNEHLVLDERHPDRRAVEGRRARRPAGGPHLRRRLPAALTAARSSSAAPAADRGRVRGRLPVRAGLRPPATTSSASSR